MDNTKYDWPNSLLGLCNHSLPLEPVPVGETSCYINANDEDSDSNRSTAYIVIVSKTQHKHDILYINEEVNKQMNFVVIVVDLDRRVWICKNGNAKCFTFWINIPLSSNKSWKDVIRNVDEKRCTLEYGLYDVHRQSWMSQVYHYSCPSRKVFFTSTNQFSAVGFGVHPNTTALIYSGDGDTAKHGQQSNGNNERADLNAVIVGCVVGGMAVLTCVLCVGLRIYAHKRRQRRQHSQPSPKIIDLLQYRQNQSDNETIGMVSTPPAVVSIHINENDKEEAEEERNRELRSNADMYSDKLTPMTQESNREPTIELFIADIPGVAQPKSESFLPLRRAKATNESTALSVHADERTTQRRSRVGDHAFALRTPLPSSPPISNDMLVPITYLHAKHKSNWQDKECSMTRLPGKDEENQQQKENKHDEKHATETEVVDDSKLKYSRTPVQHTTTTIASFANTNANVN
ncbi:hypothetical protein RFI_14379, partial [Reticulomyxa filosa]